MGTWGENSVKIDGIDHFFYLFQKVNKLFEGGQQFNVGFNQLYKGSSQYYFHLFGDDVESRHVAEATIAKLYTYSPPSLKKTK